MTPVAPVTKTRIVSIPPLRGACWRTAAFARAQPGGWPDGWQLNKWLVGGAPRPPLVPPAQNSLVAPLVPKAASSIVNGWSTPCDRTAPDSGTAGCDHESATLRHGPH